MTAEVDDQQAEISARVKLSYMDVAVTGDGDPLPDVAVWLTDPTGTNTKKITDAAGTVLFRNLDVGEHTVTLLLFPTSLTLTPTSPQTIQISEDQGHDLVFTGVFAPAQITGTAKSWGKPVEGAVVRIEGKDTVEVTVNSTGVFQVDSIRRGGSGNYTFTISNYTGVSFKQTTLTQTLESGENTAEFIGRPDPEPTWAAVDGGSWHSCGVTTAGEAYCWGSNLYGGLGDGTLENSSAPVLVGGGHTWASISAGGLYTCGVTTAGEAYCWGVGGKLGDGTTTNSSVPVLVSGGHTWASVSSGDENACGVTTTGEAYCWGENYEGQLGDGSNIRRLTPVLVSGGQSWVSVAPLFRHTCGVTTTGEIYCWGWNSNGQLGDGTTTDSLVPVLLSGGITNWASVTGGWAHTCGVITFGEAYCWGRNEDGQLGDGTTTQRLTPVLVNGGHTWASVTGGGDAHTCGVTTEGVAYCWGYNGSGNLGNSTEGGQSPSPTLVSGERAWTSVDGGSQHTCGVTTTGEAYCWGSNEWGKLGNGTTTNNSVPAKVGGNW